MHRNRHRNRLYLHRHPVNKVNNNVNKAKVANAPRDSNNVNRVKVVNAPKVSNKDLMAKADPRANVRKAKATSIVMVKADLRANVRKAKAISAVTAKADPRANVRKAKAALIVTVRADPKAKVASIAVVIDLNVHKVASIVVPLLSTRMLMKIVRM